MKLLSAEQIRQWDEYTIAHEPITSLQLMERAATRCVEWITGHVDITDRPVHIFCGKGNNGGDGLAIARQLIEKDVRVEVYILEFGHKGTKDFQSNLTILHRLTKNIHFIQQESVFPSIAREDLVIDALFGSGLNRPLEGLSAELVHHINAVAANVISIDIPSGMFIDTASIDNPVIKARHTLTFQCLKLCLLAAENSDRFGTVHILKIGLHPGFLVNAVTDIYTIELQDTANIYRPRNPFAHKGHFGHALIVGGAEGKAGAAIIATEACLRSGAGLTTVHLLNGDNAVVNARCPEAMTMAADELVKKNLQRFSSIAIGPGLGTDDIAHHMVGLLIEHYDGNKVMDADALNIIAEHKDWLQELGSNVVLTPHPKEFDRLFGEHPSELERWRTAIDRSQSLGCIIILKGHHTLVAVNGKGYFNTTGNAGLAKGGSGDALTGMVVSLLAQGYDAASAAMLGVFVHGLAADIAVEQGSYESLLASDVIAHLGNAFKKLSNVS